MREIVWDTETTGFDPIAGDRIVEIGAVELNQHLPTGKVFHQYINPERDMPPGAYEVHGLSIDFLKDFPVFSEIANEFINFTEITASDQIDPDSDVNSNLSSDDLNDGIADDDEANFVVQVAISDLELIKSVNENGMYKHIKVSGKELKEAVN